MQQYTEVVTLKISKTQKDTLGKLKQRNIKVSNFIRLAISEKLKRDAKELIVKEVKIKTPF
jgi:post-segregation antitoxin (ccd killing protein)